MSGERRWVRCFPEDEGVSVFELIRGRKSRLYVNGKRTPHDYGREEILNYVSHGDWQEISEADASALVAAGGVT